VIQRVGGVRFGLLGCWLNGWGTPAGVAGARPRKVDTSGVSYAAWGTSSLLADADALDGIQLYALSDAIESYRDAVIAQENAAFTPSRGED